MILLNDRWSDYERARRQARRNELLRWLAFSLWLVGVGIILGRIIFRK